MPSLPIVSRPPLRFGFLLLPHCSLLSLSGAIDVLAVTNRILDEPAYSSIILATDSESVASAGTLMIPVDYGLTNAPELDGVFVVSETPLPQRGFEASVAWLQKFSASPDNPRGVQQ